MTGWPGDAEGPPRLLPYTRPLGDIILGTAADPAIVDAITGMTPEEIGAADPRILVLVEQQVRAGGAAFMVYDILAAAIA